jgi:acetolactate synthase I/II/III large subunit
VNIDVPYNVYQEEDDVEVPPASHVMGQHRPGASEADIAKVVNLLAESVRPVIFIGHGATLSEAGPEITQLQQSYGIPVITSPNGMGCVPADDPLTLGFIGRNGAYPANQAGRHADLVLTIGTRFDDRSSSSWYPGYSWNFPKTKLVHVDLDPQELGRNYPPTLGIIADAKVFTAQLLQALGLRESRGAPPLKKQLSEWRAEVEGWRKEWEAYVRPNFGKLTTPLRPEYVVDALQKVLPDDAILTCDSGVHHNWFMQFWRPKRAQSCSTVGATPRWASACAA